MNTFFRYYWYAVKNFCKSLSITDILIIIFIPGLFFLFVFGSLYQTIHSQKTILFQNVQIIRNATPQILALAVLLSRLIIHPEKTLRQIYNTHGFYVTLPLTRNSILHWCLMVTLAKDSLWIILGFFFTGVLAYELNLTWFSFFGQTVQLIVLWVVTAGLISFVVSIVRIILANRIQFEKKIILKLMIFAEILFSFFVFTLLLYFRITFTAYVKAHWDVSDRAIRLIFFTSIISLLYFIIHKLFSEHEHTIKRYFETENDCYSVKEIPSSVQKLITWNFSSLVRSMLRLSLAARSYGFTKFHSLMMFSVQAIVLLLFSISISNSAISIIVFAIAATITITMFFCTILVSVPFIFTITKPLPLLFKEVSWAYMKGGLLLSIPAFMLVLLLSMCLGFSGCLKTIGLSVLLCACIVPLRMVIVLRYPYSKLLSEIAFILAISYLILSFQVFVFLPIIVLILIVIYYRKKAGALWNAAGFYENEY